MPKKKLYLNTYYRALSIIWKSDRGLFVGNIMLQFFLTITPLLNLYILKGLIDLVTKENRQNHDAIVNQVVILLAVQIVNAALNQLYQHLQNLQQQKITDYITAMVIEKAIHVPYNHYENAEYYDSLHLAQYQALYKLPGLVNSINQLFQQGLNVLLLSVLFVTIEWYYFFLFILIGFPLAFVKWYYSNKTHAFQKQNIGPERQSGYLNMVLTSNRYAKEVRVFGFGETFLKKFKEIRNQISGGKKEISYHNAWAGFWAQLIEIISVCYIYFTIAIKTLTGLISIGSFVMYFQAFQRLQASLKIFLQSLVEVFQLRMFLTDLFIFLDIPAEERQKKSLFADSVKGIEVSDVSFRYPGAEMQTLKNISIQCRANQIIAIVGANGSGKSTLVKLLTGLYPVQEGSIKINGVNVNVIPENELRKKISAILQDFNMYETTVKENINPGGGIADEDRLKLSSEAAGANSFIKNLSKGYDTRVGGIFNKSEQLSGGQWQKLAMARAFYRSHDILILDEPTSHIDPIAEFEVFENLMNNKEHKAIILITHRLYNLKKADIIYLMHEGSIAEQGSFDELIIKDGLFKMMYEKQKL